MKFKIGDFVKVKETSKEGCDNGLCKNCFAGILTISRLEGPDKDYGCIKGEIKNLNDDNGAATWCMFWEKDLEYAYPNEQKITNWREHFK